MTNDFKTNVKPAQLTVLSDDKVAIASAGLLNTFVQSPAHGIAKLSSSIAAVHPDDVRVDESGRIVITNKEFVAAVNNIKATALAESNTVCNNAYKCQAH